MSDPSSLTPERSALDILREELVRLQEWFDHRRDRPGCSAQYIHVGMALSAAERATPSETTRWVPVGERLPEKHNHLIGCAVFDGNQVTISRTHPTWWNRKDERGKEYDGPTVTHWMPLPEAPK